jgi:hypothetical protein
MAYLTKIGTATYEYLYADIAFKQYRKFFAENIGKSRWN